MTALRLAAQQALEAWDSGAGPCREAEVFEALRAALAQQAEPEGSVCARCGALAFDPLVKQQAEPVEPVAWVASKDGRVIYDNAFVIYDNAFTHDLMLRVAGDFEDDEQRARYAQRIVDKLNAAPPQRKPLTEDEIVDAVREADFDWQKGWTLDEHAPNRFATLVRAVEKASWEKNHGQA